MADYIISDMHLGHRKIIKYCHRPFKDVYDMNHTLIDNWNYTVSKGDTVYFLGDMARSNIEQWLNKLNGFIVFIKGNHDNRFEGLSNFILKPKEADKILMVHNPNYVDYDGWIFHGHIHNKNPDKYPLINFENKTVNVSCELIDYTPIPLDSLINQLN